MARPISAVLNRSLRSSVAPILFPVALAALLLAGRTALAQDPGSLVSAPLVPASTEAPGKPIEALEERLRIARDALRRGFPSIAASLLEPPPALTDWSPALRQDAVIVRSAALIALGRFPDAQNVLGATEEPEDPRIGLRLAFISAGLGEIADARELADRLVDTPLPREERSWLDLLRGLLAEIEGDTNRSRVLLDRATATLDPEGRSALLDLSVELIRLRSGRATEAMAADLRKTVEGFRGTRTGFQAARLYAIVLHQLDRTPEAVRLIEDQLSLPGVGEDEFDHRLRLLMGLILGDENPRGRESLRRVLTDNAPVALQRIALKALSRRPLAAESPGGFDQVLSQWINPARRHPLRSEMLILRARVSLREGNFEAARNDANLLVREYPDSPLRNLAWRLVAAAGWRTDPPQYRAAADALSQVRTFETDPAERQRLAAAIADCFFLAGDYATAATAYAVALDEADDPERAGFALYQQVLSDLRAGRPGAAEEHLDNTRAATVDPLYRWRAEWNLIHALEADGNRLQARNRLGFLLGVSRIREMPGTLRLRLMWLDAQLAIEAGESAEVVGKCSQILGLLEASENGEIAREQRSLIAAHTLLLQARAHILRGQPEAAASTFTKLRQSYPGEPAAQLSYLVEARHEANEGRIVTAQRRLLTLADEFPASEFAPVALWEAALLARQRGAAGFYEEAINHLGRLIALYPDHPLAFRARLQQGHLLRLLNDFPSALTLYEEMRTAYASHPEIYLVDLAIGDCLQEQGTRNPIRMADAEAVYTRVQDQANLPPAVIAEAGYKAARITRLDPGLDQVDAAYWRFIGPFLDRPEPVDATTRYWLSRGMFDLADHFREQGRFTEARRLYQIVIDRELPGQRMAAARLADPVPAGGG